MNSNQVLLNLLKERPKLYEPSTSKFWDDEHISKGMLEAHLNPEWDAATRNHKFIDKSVEWITGITEGNENSKLLDLGCGPGLYAERFYHKNYQVTGIDFSARSVQYASESAKSKGLQITYLYQNYLLLSYQEEFDVITLIYCDFGVLSDLDRKTLLDRIYHALKPGGTLIFDVFTPKRYEGIKENNHFSYHKEGFWNKEPHTCLESLYRYDECNTILNQCIVLTENTTQCYNIWEHTFTPEELRKDLTQANFKKYEFYGDVAGAEYSEDKDIICVVARK
jgi:2-polyprenyl-3-methyl-5-hydroxy-6-metoxy-1,4-benzoquinol methylase